MEIHLGSVAGTHVTSPNQLASLHSSERKDVKKNMCTSLSVCLTLALPQRQLTSIIQELYPFYKAPNVHFFEWSKSFSYRGATLWNNLAIGVKRATSFSVFKQSLFLDN